MSLYDLIVLRQGEQVGQQSLSDGYVSIGRSPFSDLVLDAAIVSRNHARLEIQGGKVTIRDLASGSGTFVRGIRVTSTTLTAGDEIMVGPYILRLVLRKASSKESAGAPGESALPGGFRDSVREILNLTSVVGVADLKAVLEVLLERTMGLFAAARGYVVLVTETGLSPVLTHTGEAPSAEDSFSRTICAEAVETRAPVVRRIDPSVSGEQEIQSLRYLRQATLVAAIPLVDSIGGQDRPLGAMYLEAPQTGPSLLGSQTELFSQVARVGGRALRVAQERRQIVSDRDQWRWLAMQLEEDPDLFQSSRSEAMRPVLDLVQRAAPSDVTVLIQGETGTGKEVVARTIHRFSPRSQYPFVAVNCAALPVDLIEAELFGYEKGAFTGATSRHLGRLEMARGGTLVLDEVGDMRPDMQSKLLRVLETRTFERLGGSESLSADVRILAATHRDLEAAVACGEFRQDLFYRLNVVRIRLPPLRERIEDIEPLVHQMLMLNNRRLRRKLYGIAPDAMRALEAHSWPGNIRELRNAIERAFIVESGDLISLQSLPLSSQRSQPVSSQSTAVLPVSEPLSLPQSVADLPSPERRGAPLPLAKYLSLHEVAYIRLIMDSVGGNVVRAAEILELTRTSLHRKLRRLGLASSSRDSLRQGPADKE